MAVLALVAACSAILNACAATVAASVVDEPEAPPVLFNIAKHHLYHSSVMIPEPTSTIGSLMDGKAARFGLTGLTISSVTPLPRKTRQSMPSLLEHSNSTQISYRVPFRVASISSHGRNRHLAPSCE